MSRAQLILDLIDFQTVANARDGIFEIIKPADLRRVFGSAPDDGIEYSVETYRRDSRRSGRQVDCSLVEIDRSDPSDVQVQRTSLIGEGEAHRWRSQDG